MLRARIWQRSLKSSRRGGSASDREQPLRHQGEIGPRSNLIRLFEDHGAVLRCGDGALRQPGRAGASRHGFEYAGDADREAVPGRPVPPGDSGSGILRPLHPRGRSGQRPRALVEQDFSRQGRPVFGGCEGRHAHHAYRGGRSQSATLVGAGNIRRGRSDARAERQRTHRALAGDKSRR